MQKHPDLIHDGSHHLTPTLLTIFFSIVLIINMSIANTIQGLSVWITSIVCIGVVGMYAYRTKMNRYVVTTNDVAIVHGYHEEAQIKHSMPILDIGYVYVRHTGLRYLLWKLGIANYGDVCCCESVFTPPLLVFHNIVDAEFVCDMIKNRSKELHSKLKMQ